MKYHMKDVHVALNTSTQRVNRVFNISHLWLMAPIVKKTKFVLYITIFSLHNISKDIIRHWVGFVDVVVLTPQLISPKKASAGQPAGSDLYNALMWAATSIALKASFSILPNDHRRRPWNGTVFIYFRSSSTSGSGQPTVATSQHVTSERALLGWKRSGQDGNLFHGKRQ